MNYVSDFRLNQIGFPNKATKRFVYTGEATDTFTVCQMRNARYTVMYTGTFTKYETDEVSPACLVGDFSEVTESGVYRIFCGEKSSRTFYIGDKMYDSLCRTMVGSYAYQRCGDETGYNPCCHMNDHLVDKYGVDHHICGGHHQSGEVRKWACTSPIATYNLSEYYRLMRPRWDRGDNIPYDVAHSAKYFLSRISRDGYVFDCTFLPEDYNDAVSRGVGFERYDSWWGPIRYYDTPTDLGGHYFVSRLLASAFETLKDSDPAFAATCLDGAEKVWNYMQSEGEQVDDYYWETFPPMGHDPFFVTYFDYFYPNSTCLLAARACAGMALYKATGNETYKARVLDALDTIASRFVKDKDGALDHFILGDKDGRVAEGWVYFVINFSLCFADALLLWPQDERADTWKDLIEATVRKYEKQAAANAYDRTTNHCAPANTGEPLKWDYWSPSFVADMSDTAQFLTKAAPFAGKERCLGLAQRMLDFILGGNPCDCSCVEGVGYNHLAHALFGEYYPSQPQIPGCVITEFLPHDPDFNWFGREYDLPCGSTLLYAAALYQKAMDALLEE